MLQLVENLRNEISENLSMSRSEDIGGVDVVDKPPGKKEKSEPSPPKKYKVILHNDDFTPMEFVVFILREFFHKTEEEANSIILDVHKKGYGIAGIYDYQIAEQKVSDVSECAKHHEYPLKVSGEPT